MFVTKYIIVGPNQLGYMVIPRHKVQSKIHKLTFCTMVSSIGAYNYKLAKFLGELFNPTIPSQHCATNSFSFCKEIQEVSGFNKFMISYDAWKKISFLKKQLN